MPPGVVELDFTATIQGVFRRGLRDVGLYNFIFVGRVRFFLEVGTLTGVTDVVPGVTDVVHDLPRNVVNLEKRSKRRDKGGISGTPDLHPARPAEIWNIVYS
jgi:hypothetical protein